MEKLVKAIVFPAIVYGLPLSTDTQALWSLPVLLALAAALTLLLSQPDVARQDALGSGSKDRGSVITILFTAVLVHILPVFEWKLRGFPGMSGFPTALQSIGFVVAVAGLWLRLRAIRVLGRFFTSTVQILGDHQLVRTGPYARIRHPAYAGALVAMIGHSLLLAAPISAAVTACIMVAVYHYRIRVEEAALSDAFGEHFASYRTRTRRLVPGVW